jgi:serine/threonine protein kinase
VGRHRGALSRRVGAAGRAGGPNVADADPEVFGKYFLIDKIATGGMAEIFRAKSFAEGGFESLFVIKRILPHLGEDPGFVELFVIEAKVSVALQHPNIVRVFDFGKIGPHFFIAMEHIDGRDLRRVLRQAGGKREILPRDLALYVALEACKGLHFAHTRTAPDGEPLGIVHRDISPSNLLLSWDGDVKLADFGIARADWVAGEEEGDIRGKCEYMSPEQAEGRPVDGRSDVFSLGVVLYELFTGRRAFKANTVEETRRRLLQMDLPRPSVVEPSIPSALEAVILKAMAPDPAQRFGSARDLGEAVRRLLGGRNEDTLREELSRWLRSLFHEEMREEAARVREASDRALQLRDELEAQEFGASSAGAAAARRRDHQLGLFAVLLLGVLGVLLTALILPGREEAVPVVDVASTGAIQFQVQAGESGRSASVRVFLSGRPIGAGGAVLARDLAPGEYEVRVEADGYKSVLDRVKVTRDAVTRFQRTLEPLAADAPSVQIVSRPAGAVVRIDGRWAGITPFMWRDGTPGERYAVSLALDGYVPVSGVIEGLVAGGRASFSRDLSAEGSGGRSSEPPSAAAPSAPSSPSASPSANAAPSEAAPSAATPPPSSRVEAPKATAPPAASGVGQLKVMLMGATWANVYVDGKKLPSQAPFASAAVPAGTHEIRVENPAAGLNYTQQVVVEPGGFVTVRASPK